MKKAYVYAYNNVIIYLFDGEVRLIADDCDAEMVENGIELTGTEIVYLESQPEINADINFDDITTEAELILRDRIVKHIKDNDL